MREIAGQLHDGQSSRAPDAHLRVYPDGSVRLAWDDVEAALRVEELEIPGRLGSTARRIGLPDGRAFETLDNDGVDALLAEHADPKRNWLHGIESRLVLVLASIVVVLAVGTLFVVRGVPAIARQAAFAVTPELAGQLGEGTLAILDRSLVESELPEERRNALRAGFADVLDGAPAGYEYELLFRGGGGLGANALALPSGKIVLTDELVALAEHDEELVAVLAHEVGHVVHRHGLRHVIQSSMFAIAVFLVTGDISSTTGFVAAVPAALAEASFSREFEREADDHAVAYLRSRDIPVKRFADLLQRLAEETGDIEGLAGFLSTHPTTDERIERLSGAGG